MFHSLLIPSDEALADNWGDDSTDTGCMPDNATLADSKNHLYWYEQLGRRWWAVSLDKLA